MTITHRSVTLFLPSWIDAVLDARGLVHRADDARMDLVVALSRENVANGSGGPFGAAIFDDDTGRLVGAGVNLVVEQRCSPAHAEIVAIMMTQQALHTHDLRTGSEAGFCLVSSTEPCAMCLGAIPWSGVRRLVCGARGEDAEAIGMDEGSKPADWVGALEGRGIHVTRDVRRNEAREVLQQYARNGGIIYNGAARGRLHND